MKEIIKVNAISKWNGELVDRVTGEVKYGTPFTKLFLTSKTEIASENKRGLFETEYKGEFSLYDKFFGVSFPCEVEVDMTLRPNSKGIAEVWVLGVAFPVPVVPEKKVV